MMASSSEAKTFVLVQGFCHDKWHWNLLQNELENRGHSTVTLDLPLSDPGSSFDDYAEIIADTIEHEENTVGVFHSRAGNYGPRAVNILQARQGGKLAMERMVFLCSSFEADTLYALGRPELGEAVPARNTPRSRRAIIPSDLGKDIKMFDPALVGDVLYHDVEDAELVNAAIAHLIPQNRPVREPQMTTWPDIPQHYIYCSDDRMVRPEWSTYVANQWLGVEPIAMAGGHSPFLSRPAQLAEVLINTSM